jgi:polyhydroxybutyrate depolymerase
MIRASVRGFWFLAVLMVPGGVAAQTGTADAKPVRKQWQVEGKTREALLYLPSKDSPSRLPVVFGFHGHGGTAPQAARSFQLHQNWPEALVVYMQGIPTPGRLSDPEGKRNGWQHDAGDHGDRDLKFFDAVFASLKKEYSIDEGRVYATGHSNGGAFTYLLWAQRPDVFAAFAPSGAGSRAIRTLKPKPALHVAGEKDELVKFAGQQRVMQAVRAINGCEEQATEWGKGCLHYASKKGAPFVSFIYPGGHRFPAEAPPIIVKFFKEHPRKAPSSP